MASDIVSSDEITALFATDWILVLLVFLALMFYFNRFIGWLLTLAINVVLWKLCKVSIHFQSFKISLLAGRIFVKNFSVVTKDFAVCILEGNITWRYWFLNVKNSEYNLVAVEESQGGESDLSTKNAIRNDKLPARFMVQIDGLELFVYNRTYAYEYVLDELKRSEEESKEGIRQRKQPNAKQTEASGVEQSDTTSDEKTMDEPGMKQSNLSSSSLFHLLHFLPVDFHINKCGIVLGNENTTSIIVGSFTSGHGSFDIGPAANPVLDHYRHNIKLTLDDLKIQFKPNVSYKEPISSAYLNSNNFNIHEEYLRKRKQRRYKKYKTLWHDFLDLTRKHALFSKKQRKPEGLNAVESNAEWKGLPQYLDDSDDTVLYKDKGKLSQEYAIYRTVLDSNKCNILYYYDIPGAVPSEPRTRPETGPDVGNSGDPPKTGVRVSLSESTIYYGPWADRQRISFYKVFFPQANNFMDCKPSDKLKRGQTRIYTYFEFSVKFEDDRSIVRIPMREYSKDLAKSIVGTKEESPAKKEVKSRPFAWLELKLYKNSLVECKSEYERTADGSEVVVDVSLKRPEIRSSINHNIFFRASEHCSTIKINFPLIWKSIICWNIVNCSAGGELFLLREHVSLISDLLNDFATMENSLLNNASEMVNSYNCFRPYEYNIEWQFRQGVKLYMNVNSENIINNPLDFDDNTYVSFQTSDLDINLQVAMHEIFQKAHCISYSICSDKLALALDTPAWNTLNTFLKDNELANGEQLQIEGSYTYYSSIEVDLVDEIIVNCKLSNTTFQAYGFLIKHIMDIKENYFGDHVHFQTLEEYTDRKAEGSVDESLEETKKIRRTENEIDVLFSFCVDNGCLILPCNLYDSDTFIAARLPNFDIDIRFTNYYMDLQCDIAPLKVVYVENDPLSLQDAVHNSAWNNDPDMFIDGIVIHGHRVFGLPPLEPTYICKWDLSVGAVASNSHIDFLKLLGGVAQKIGYTFVDYENSMIVKTPELNDVTIVCFQCPSVSLTVRDKDQQSRLDILLEPVSAKFNDLANGRYSSRMDLKIKNIVVKMESLATKQLLLYTTTSLYITNFCRKKDFFLHGQKQQDHLKLHDGPFHRAPFFLTEQNRDDSYNKDYTKVIASLSLPDIAPPLTNQSVDLVFDEFPFGDQEPFDDISESLYSMASDTSDNSSLLEFLPARKLAEGKVRSFSNKVVFGENSQFSQEELATPQLDMSDQRYEYDNFIFNIGVVDMFVSPKAIDGLVSVAEGFVSYSPNGILDSLQMEVLLTLLKNEVGFFLVRNVRLITSVANIYYGDFSNSVNVAVFEKQIAARNQIKEIFTSGHLQVSVNEPSLAMCFKDALQNAVSSNTITMALSVPTINIGLFTPGLSSAADLTVRDAEVWLNEQSSVVSSFNLDDVILNIADNHIEWVSSQLEHHTKVLQPSIERLAILALKSVKNYIELIYKLSVASEHYKIHHDSSVLTRPTHIVRNSETRHVRSYDSWRILVRLRHVLKSLPAGWEHHFTTDEWTDYHFALETVLRVFSKWRSWEFFDIKQNYIFKKVFSMILDHNVANKSDMGVNFAIASLQVKLGSAIDQSVANTFDSVWLENVECEVFADDDIKVALNVDTVGAQVSLISMVLLNLNKLNEFYKQPENSIQLAHNEQAANSNQNIHLTIVVNQINNTVTLGKISHEFHMEDLISTHYISNDQSFSSVAKVGALQSILLLEQETFALNKINSLSWDCNGTDGFKGLLLFNSHMGSINVDISRGSYDYINLLEVLYNDEMVYINQVVDAFRSEESSENSTGNDLGLQKAQIGLNIDEVTYNIEVLSPILLVGCTKNISLSALSVKKLFFVELFSDSVALDVIHNLYSKKFLARYKQPSPMVKLKGDMSKPLVLAEIFTGTVDVSIPLLLRSISDVFGSKEELLSDWLEFERLFEDIVSSLKSPSKSGSKNLSSPDDILFKVQVYNDIMKLGLGIDETKGEFILNNWSVVVQNYKTSETKCYEKTAINGNIILPKVTFCLSDPVIPPKTESVIDFHLDMKLGRPKDPENTKRAIEITSEYFFFSLNPYTLVKLMELAARFTMLKEKFFSTKTSAAKAEKTSLFSSFAIHILSYNFYFGWLYGNAEQEGLILGCERVYIISEETFGKLTIVDGYCSTSKGSTYQEFYQQSNKKQRALLPNVQLIYSIIKLGKSNRCLNVRVTGEVLDVQLVSEHIRGTDKFIKSIVTAQKLKGELVPKIARANPATDEPGYMESLSSIFTSLNCVVSFAGASVRIENSTLENSFLLLHSPAMEISLGYKKIVGPVEHLVRCEMTTFASDNVLDSNCVPVLVDLWNVVNSLLKEEALAGSKEETSAVEDGNNVPNDKSIDFVSLLKNIDFSGLINIQSQSLTLSCAPSAKINAVVSTNGIKLHLGTVEDVDKLITGTLFIGETKVNLQHAYSREDSGSVSVGKVLVNGMIQQENDRVKIYTSGEMAKVKSFIKTIQLQDLTVFKDIWLPQNKTQNPFDLKVPNIVVGSEIKGSPKPKSKNFAERVQQVSTTNAYPWNFNFVVSDVSLKVDLGQSLGVATLNLDRFWVAQAKSSDWEQNLTLGINTIVLECVGRLAGEVAVRNVSLNSVIKWAHEESFYEIPLVFLSGGVATFEMIVGFDFHTFFVFNVDELYLSLFNQKDHDEAQIDRLFGTANLRGINIYSTCLAASSFMDIVNAFMRIRADNKSSYTEALRDGGSLGLQQGKNKKDYSILERFTNLKTQVGVSIDQLLFQVYPSSLTDTDVLVIRSGKISAKYIRRLNNNEISSNLFLQWNNLDVALSKLGTSFNGKIINSSNLDNYIKHASKASGGTIFVLPLISISMQTWQLKDSKVVRYSFNSSFGGKVDIRWNLGSVGVIKAMYESHDKALSARIAKNKVINYKTNTDSSLQKTEKTLESLRIREKFEHAEQDREYLYIAIEPPIIEPPRLKELGDVTPPLEWFGLHRKNFPALTHHFIILPLEQFVKNVEKQYNAVLGKA